MLYILLHPVLGVIVEWSHLNVRDHPDQLHLKHLDLKYGKGLGCTLESKVLLLLLLLEGGHEPNQFPSHGCAELLCPGEHQLLVLEIVDGGDDVLQRIGDFECAGNLIHLLVSDLKLV